MMASAFLVNAQKITIKGSDTVLPLAQKEAEVFMKKNSGKSKMGKVIADVVRKLNQAVFRINGKTACLFLVPIKLLTMVLIPAE